MGFFSVLVRPKTDMLYLWSHVLKGSWHSHVLLCSTLSDSQNASNTSPVYESSDLTERPAPTSQWTVCLQSLVLVIQGLGTALMALIYSLVMLLISPHCLHSSGACSLLVYLDPGLCLLAVMMLIITAMPQVRLCVFMSRPN